jgi:hypothetical protein
MDELLSLFNTDDDTAAAYQSTKTTQDVNPPPSINNDDFGSSFETISTRNLPSQRIPTVTPSSRTSIANKNTSSTPQDPITHLRIVDRHTSLSCMLDAFSPYHYKSSCRLAAMSKDEWSTHIIQPRGDSGKTNLVTVGIVTNDVGSKLSKSSGRAFAMLQLGDLPSNTLSFSSTAGGTICSSITVFLFGDALRVLNANTKHYLNRGYAVGVLGPNVMPPKKDDRNTTSVSLSVSDPKQIVLIGRALDCDRCKGTIRKRTTTEYGNKFEDVRCGTLIDLRMGLYCPTHKRQGLSSKGGAVAASGKSNANNNTMTFMQRQRIESSTKTTTVKQLGKRDLLGVV